MKISLILFFLSISVFTTSNSPNDYEYKLFNIAGDFRNNVMDEDKCRRLMNDALSIVYDIEDELKNDEYSATEIAEFKKLKKKAEALEAYIGAIGGSTNAMPTISEFNYANSLVRGDVAIVFQEKFCIDIISVKIDNFTAYLGENNSISNYSVSYKWKAPDGISKGNGTMGLPKKTVRHIYDNRDKPMRKSIVIYEVTCTSF